MSRVASRQLFGVIFILNLEFLKMANVNKFLFGNVDYEGDDSNPSYSSDVPGGRHNRWFDPKQIASRRNAALAQEASKLNRRTFSDVTLEPTSWLLEGLIPKGHLTALVGPPGTSKSTIACAIAAAVSQGAALLHPNIKCNKRGRVILVSNEDDIGTLAIRLTAAGADLTRVSCINAKEGKNGESPFSLANERDQNRLRGLNYHFEDNVELIILDPFQIAIEGDHANNAKARQGLESVAKFAHDLDCSILVIAHTVKNPIGKDPNARIAGAAPVREVPRSILLTGKIKSGPTESRGTHVLVQVKNNLGKTDRGFEYCVSEVDIPNLTGIGDQNTTIPSVKIVFTAERFGSAEEILQEAERPKPVKNKTDLAEEFLLTTLKNGQKPLFEIEELALLANITKGTLKLAKSNLKIKATKQKGDGRSIWSLPESPTG
ncbi:AAA family ATPase [Methylomonas fluvii]|uniref:AAA family ATPase n=1 Tax=Methylomonas fluvii TaxID=1854564 RepID=UPI0018A79016|nr:AAA family ATPase [Methylomonas fluvii]